MTATIANFGIQSLPMQALLANMIKVLADPIQVVRDAAVLGIEVLSVNELFPNYRFLRHHCGYIEK